MKSHDCHVLMTQILPVAIRGIMDAHVRETLFGLCNFFDVISRKSVGVRQLRRLQEEIVVILCELEMYFPPAFFDVMVHLLVHIVEDIIQLGPMFLHSMMPFPPIAIHETTHEKVVPHHIVFRVHKARQLASSTRTSYLLLVISNHLGCRGFQKPSHNAFAHHADHGRLRV
ncbi:hypothetical protein QYE76_010991 [Lolium multiflorum]|uniref:DUF4218 domain-containing protein n=1 Tax=Lolium multiflorum TaxID=4521 RepID=A0AAD8X572_LOLMU|nr:hypothetical protein QYE76_010991 [Lolium multiflorum]